MRTCNQGHLPACLRLTLSAVSQQRQLAPLVLDEHCGGQRVCGWWVREEAVDMLPVKAQQYWQSTWCGRGRRTVVARLWLGDVKLPAGAKVAAQGSKSQLICVANG